MTHTEAMLGAFGNSRGDLEANRQGQLGPAQVARLKRSAWLHVFGSAVVVTGLAAFLLFVAPRPLGVAQCVVTVLLGAGVTLLGALQFKKARAAAAAGRVECVVGQVQAQMRGRAGWFLVVAGRSFKLPIRFFHVKNGASYRLYVAPELGRIVAMEPEGWT